MILCYLHFRRIPLTLYKYTPEQCIYLKFICSRNGMESSLIEVRAPKLPILAYKSSQASTHKLHAKKTSSFRFTETQCWLHIRIIWFRCLGTKVELKKQVFWRCSLAEKEDKSSTWKHLSSVSPMTTDVVNSALSSTSINKTLGSYCKPNLTKEQERRALLQEWMQVPNTVSQIIRLHLKQNIHSNSTFLQRPYFWF